VLREIPNTRAISEIGQVASAVAADDASSGHGNARLNKLQVAEPACGVSTSAG
jgi:hypothetical protein